MRVSECECLVLKQDLFIFLLLTLADLTLKVLCCTHITTSTHAWEITLFMCVEFVCVHVCSCSFVYFVCVSRQMASSNLLVASTIAQQCNFMVEL